MSQRVVRIIAFLHPAIGDAVGLCSILSTHGVLYVKYKSPAAESARRLERSTDDPHPLWRNPNTLEPTCAPTLKIPLSYRFSTRSLTDYPTLFHVQTPRNRHTQQSRQRGREGSADQSKHKTQSNRCAVCAVLSYSCTFLCFSFSLSVSPFVILIHSVIVSLR